MRLKPFVACAVALLLSFSATAQLTRAEVPDKFKWDLTDLYPSNAAWFDHKDKLVAEIQELEQYHGKLGESAQMLFNYFDKYDYLIKEFNKLFSYAVLIGSQDLTIDENRALSHVFESAYMELQMVESSFTDEISQIPDSLFYQFLKQYPKLNEYRMLISDIIRQRMHTLSDDEENLIVQAGMMGGSFYKIFSLLMDAEMPCPTITLANGESVELTQTNYPVVMASRNRADRAKAFKAFWENYGQYQGSCGEILTGQIQYYDFCARAHKFENTLQAQLFADSIPESVYYSLIENVNKNLPTFHRYLKLKKRMLGVDLLQYFDMYAPTVEDADFEITYEAAQGILLEAFKPLGADYVKNVKKAFDGRWIDVYPTKGKESGGYAEAGAYDVHPYILINFTGDYAETSTIAHEMGHAMHALYSEQNQTHANANYSLFVAEIASTFNEALFNDYMLQNSKSKAQRISILMNILNDYKGTLFRQALFAEFELEAHKLVEQNEPTTGQILSDLYGKLLRKYFGHDQGVCYCNELANVEWSYVPHFYQDGFSVYTYCTSFTATQSLVSRILSGDKDALNRYIKLLSSGGSDYPINQLKEAGVDLTTSEPFDLTIKRMNELMDEVERLLE